MLVNYTGRHGGGPLDAYEMARALVEHGMPVAAVLSDQIDNLNAWKKLDLVNLTAIATYHNAIDLAINTALFRIRQEGQIKRALSEFDVRYVYCPMGAFWTEAINSIFPTARKGLVIHDPIPHSGEDRKIDPFRMRRESQRAAYDHLFVHSEVFVDYVREKYHVPTSYIPLGSHSFYKTCGNGTVPIDYDPKRVTFLFFGRISKYKGLDILAEAYARVHGKLPDKVSLAVVGNGDFSPYRDAYASLPDVMVVNRWIDDAEVDGAFTGENLVCVCPYRDATQSGVALLAMDYGVPLIVTATGGMEDQVEDGVTGLLVPPSDPTALAEAMVRLASDRKLRMTMRESQEEHMRTQGWDASALRLIEAAGLDELLR